MDPFWSDSNRDKAKTEAEVRHYSDPEAVELLDKALVEGPIEPERQPDEIVIVPPELPRDLIHSVRQYLSTLWYDPRFGLRFAVGFLDDLLNRSPEELAEMKLEDVRAIETL